VITLKKKTTRKTKSKKVTLRKPDLKGLFLLVLALIIVVLAALFISRLSKTNQNQPQSKGEKTIAVPSNVLPCPKSFYEKNKDGTWKVNANQYSKQDICQYYKTIKEETTKIQNLQYNNEVVACRFFEANGEQMLGKIKYIHLGYEKKPCYQGVYQK